jgi:adenylate cyclase
MESYSGPGKIQVTEATYWRLHEKYDLTAQGIIDIEGIGKVEASLLIGRKQA